MASPENWAQDVIACEVCYMPTQFFCNNCQLSLCQDCVHRHKSNSQSLFHEIVHFCERNIKVAEGHVCSMQQCDAHYENYTKQHCTECYSPFPRKLTKLREKIEAHERRMKKIIDETQEIKFNVLPHYHEANVHIETKIANIKEDFVDLKKKRENSRQIWHQEVDDIFDKIDCLSQFHRKDQLDALLSNQKLIKNLISEMSKTVKLNERILKTKKISEINNYKFELKEYLINKIPEIDRLKMPYFKTYIVQAEQLRIVMGDFKATMTQGLSLSNAEEVPKLLPYSRQSLYRVNVLTSVRSNYNTLYRLVCIESDEAWMLGNSHVITRIDINGLVKVKVNIMSLSWPDDISVTSKGELIYTDRDSKTVKIVRHGMIKTVIRPPQVWEPHSLCWTRSGNILIHMMETSHTTRNVRNRIICYQGERIVRIINKDVHGDFILSDGYFSIYMTQNGNGDICVSDVNAKIVVVVDKMESVRFRYDGKQAKKREFSVGLQ